MSKIENIILVIALLWLSFGIIDHFYADTEIDYTSYDGFISSTEDLASSIIEKMILNIVHLTRFLIG
ncbi:hypothetical protein [Methanolobus bombayensis]|uniref:hypothetical protein n=1 Tax=Methanolobus bombayensis TaxID=38023 RepID=UPI001AE92FEB|nr:hypothetical protein [Methanolobus bombayensis]MBP1909287.1 hypothetical protein [Methanolobus bombayensis]